MQQTSNKHVLHVELKCTEQERENHMGENLPIAGMGEHAEC